MFPNRVPKDKDTPSQEPLVYSVILVCLQDS